MFTGTRDIHSGLPSGRAQFQQPAGRSASVQFLEIKVYFGSNQGGSRRQRSDKQQTGHRALFLSSRRAQFAAAPHVTDKIYQSVTRTSYSLFRRTKTTSAVCLARHRDARTCCRGRRIRRPKQLSYVTITSGPGPDLREEKRRTRYLHGVGPVGQLQHVVVMVTLELQVQVRPERDRRLGSAGVDPTGKSHFASKSRARPIHST